MPVNKAKHSNLLYIIFLYSDTFLVGFPQKGRKIMNNLSLQESADTLIGIMESLKYAKGTIAIYRSVYRRFIIHCHSLGVDTFDESIALSYANEITGKELSDLAKCNSTTGKYAATLRALRLLSEYCRTGTFTPRFSQFHEPVEKDPYWNNIYDGFFEHLCFDCDYAESSIKHKELTVRLMINILIQRKVKSLDEIDSNVMNIIISQFIHEAPKSVKHRIGEMKQFFQYCFDSGLSRRNLIYLIPDITVPHVAAIPLSWTDEEVKQLLESIDRDSVSGKRDYALLIMACMLGLRAIDLVNIELSDFDWERKIITVRQKKTRNTVTLPLLNDIGWAVIDYIRNGRPKTDDKHLFIRLNAPYNGMGNSGSVERIFTNRLHKAGLRVKRNQKCGIHSLRHTLGSLLLEKETPLPVISQILGHRSIQSTETYLRINMKGLLECPIDPQKVFDHEV